MPPTPPQVSVRPTAKRAFRDVVVLVVLFVVSVGLVIVIGGSSGSFSVPGLLAMLGVSAVGITALFTAVRRWGRAQIAELQCGYTTLTFAMGQFWAFRSVDGPITHGWVEWRWDATWVLRPDGSVISMPSGDAEPPGLYPSPRREDALELWTGRQWSGYLPEQTG